MWFRRRVGPFSRRPVDRGYYVRRKVYLPSITRTQVGADLDTTYRIKNTVAQTKDTSYRILNTVAQTQGTSYRILNTVAQTQGTSYRILNIVAQTQATSYRIINVVGADEALTYRILGTVAQTRSTSYQLKNVVGASQATTYRILNVVTASQSLSWEILSDAQAGANLALSWQIQNVVTQSQSTSYKIRNTVGVSLNTSWRIAQPTSVSGSLPISWQIVNNVRISVGRTRRHAPRWWQRIYNRAAIWAPPQTHAPVHIQVGTELVVQYRIRTTVLSVASLLRLRYRILGTARKSLPIKMMPRRDVVYLQSLKMIDEDAFIAEYEWLMEKTDGRDRVQVPTKS